MNTSIIKTVLMAAILISIMLYQEGINHKVRLLEIQAQIKIGMTESQATSIMGEPPRVIVSGEKLNPKLTFPKAIRCPNDKVLRYSKGFPSCYITVHVNPKGLIDALLFMES